MKIVYKGDKKVVICLNYGSKWNYVLLVIFVGVIRWVILIIVILLFNR